MSGRLYDRRTWRRLREQVLRAEPLCRMCRERGRAVPAVDVDHITPLADGGEPYDLANLRPLCHPCHARVTSAAKTGKPLRPDVDAATGMPIGSHWWNEQ